MNTTTTPLPDWKIFALAFRALCATLGLAANGRREMVGGIGTFTREELMDALYEGRPELLAGHRDSAVEAIAGKLAGRSTPDDLDRAWAGQLADLITPHIAAARAA